MDDVAKGARARMAKMALDDGLALLFFGFCFLIEGSLGLIGKTMPRETVRFDLFNMGFLRLALIAAAFFWIRKVRSKFIVRRKGFVTPHRSKWYVLVFALFPIVTLLMLTDYRDAITKLMGQIGQYDGTIVAVMLAAMFLIGGVQAGLPRMIWLGSVLLIVGMMACRFPVKFEVIEVVLGIAITAGCGLQFRSYLNAHPMAEFEHA